MERRAYSVHRLGHRSAALFFCYCYCPGVLRARPLRVVEGRLFFLPGPCSFIFSPLFLLWSRMAFRLGVVKAKGQGQREYAGAILRPRRGGRSVEGWELCLVQRPPHVHLPWNLGPSRSFPAAGRKRWAEMPLRNNGIFAPLPDAWPFARARRWRVLSLGYTPTVVWKDRFASDGFWSVRSTRIDLLLTGRCLLLLV